MNSKKSVESYYPVSVPNWRIKKILQNRPELPRGSAAQRASLSSFTQLTPVGPVFSQCTGCSPRVLSQLRSQGWDMVRQVMESPKYLEDLTGLTDLMSDADLMAAVIDLSDDDSFSVSSGDV